MSRADQKGMVNMATDGHLNFDTKINESGFNKGISKLGGLAKVGVASIGAMMGAGIAAFGAVTKASLDSVASMEQNIGGVETLFKDSADTVIANANRAYKTAGMSANEYMSNVTSFSASLLQSLAGDTQAAAEVADMAMTDMSDNANKMGTDMESIQNAYQGFAKQNYTMLDNLKLGYGGTKSEMERLLADAEKLTGVKYDINNLSDVYKAIHAIQENLGITGTTAKEAATTIEGSMNSAKAAWDNFLAGTATAEEFADAFGVATESIIKNLGEIVPRLAATIPVVVSEIYQMFVEEFNDKGDQLFATGSQIIADILTGIVGALPQLATMAVSIGRTLLSAIIDSAPQLKEAGMNLIRFLIDGMKQVPRLLNTGLEILDNIVSGFVDAIPEALPKILDFVQDIGDKISESAPGLIQKGFEILQKVVDGIVSAIPILIEKVPKIISTFANIINDNFPTILMKGAQLLGQLGLGIIKAIPTLVANIPQIIQAIIDALMAFQWLNLGRNIIKGLCDGVKAMAGAAKTAGKNILDSIKNAFLNLPGTLANLGKSAIYNLGATISGLKSYAMSSALKIVSGIESALLQLPSKMISIGKNLVKGLWNGISDMTGWIISKIKGFGDSVLSGIKSFFGIHSPSTVFRDQVGKMMALGIGVGFEKNIPLKSMNAGLQKAVSSLKKDVIFTTSARSGKTVGEIKNNPEFGSSGGTDWDEWERRQRRINKERDSRPIFLNTDRIDRPLPKGAVPVW